MMYLKTKTNRPVSLSESVFNHFFDDTPRMVRRGFHVDITETDTAYQIQADLPGFEAADVDVKIEEGFLHIEAKKPEVDKTESKEEKGITWHLRERNESTVQRSFALPKDVEKDHVDAEMKNGILRVELRKTPQAQPLSIHVKG